MLAQKTPFYFLDLREKKHTLNARLCIRRCSSIIHHYCPLGVKTYSWSTHLPCNVCSLSFPDKCFCTNCVLQTFIIQDLHLYHFNYRFHNPFTCKYFFWLCEITTWNWLFYFVKVGKVVLILNLRPFYNQSK